MGRRMFDGGEIPWGDIPPFQAPVFVVTHRDREVLHRQGGTSFTFVTGGIGRAIELAGDAAGGKDVAVAGGGTLLRQVLAAGLLDELELHIVNHSGRHSAHGEKRRPFGIKDLSSLTSRSARAIA